MKKYVLGDKRNSTLAELIKNEGYTCSQQVSNLNLFWGWDLYFKDKESQSYRWTMKWKFDRWEPQLYAVDDKGKIISEGKGELKRKLTYLRMKFEIEAEEQ